jgi:hypothetical protein
MAESKWNDYMDLHFREYAVVDFKVRSGPGNAVLRTRHLRGAIKFPMV